MPNASVENVTSKQAKILEKLQTDAPASSESSRRGLFTGMAASVTGGCMCGICGASPAQAAAPGDWGYSMSRATDLCVCGAVPSLCSVLAANRKLIVQVLSRSSSNRLVHTLGDLHVQLEVPSHQWTCPSARNHAPPRTFVKFLHSESPPVTV